MGCHVVGQDGLRECGKCRERKPLAEFYFTSAGPGRTSRWSYWCRACHRFYLRTQRNNLLALMRAQEHRSYYDIPDIGKKGATIPIRIMGAADAAYAAGLVDGEGSISIPVSSRLGLLVEIGNTSPAMILWLHERVGGGWRKSSRDKRPQNRRQMYAWRTSGASAVTFLRQLHRFLVVKKRVAEVAILCLEANQSRNVDLAISYALEVRKLNRWGRRKHYGSV